MHHILVSIELDTAIHVMWHHILGFVFNIWESCCSVGQIPGQLAEVLRVCPAHTNHTNHAHGSMINNLQDSHMAPLSGPGPREHACIRRHRWHWHTLIDTWWLKPPSYRGHTYMHNSNNITKNAWCRLFDNVEATWETHIHTYVHTYIHTYTHNHNTRHESVHSWQYWLIYYWETYIHTCIHTYMHVYTHNHILDNIDSLLLRDIHTDIHTYIHTYIPACMHACIHT